MLVLIRLASIQTFGMNGTAYWLALVKAVGNFTPPENPIALITGLAGLLGFIGDGLINPPSLITELGS